jgi:protein TonB
MNAAARIATPYLDQPWRRLAWIAPLSILVWAAVLICFSLLLEQASAPSPEIKPLEARIVELPPAVGGLQGGAAPAAAHPAAPAPAKPKPQVEVKRKVVPPVVHHRKPQVLPAAPPSDLGIKKAPVEPAPVSNAPPAKGAPSSSSSSTETSTGSGVPGGGGEGSGSGLGSDSAGARAVFAPVPKIPDDMREEAFEGVAVAHFKISYDGDVSVSLATPTSSPRLNQILIETLKQWRFFPAMKNGVAIDSEFNVRIPISVQ